MELKDMLRYLEYEEPAGGNGPLLSDEAFFATCLNLEYPGLSEVKEAVGRADYAAARRAFAAHVRASLDPDRFFSVPYEVPENVYKLEGESDYDACRRIAEHTLVSCGVPCVYGKGQPVDWKANPTYNGYKEWTWQLSRHPEWKLLAHEYRRTGEEWMAETVAELFTSWVRQAERPESCPGFLTKCWRTIECGIRMGSNWLYVLFTFYRTPAFTDDLLTDWYKSVWEHGRRLSENHMTGNWLIMEMNGLGQIGVLYPEFALSAAWYEQAVSSLEEELDRQIYADGFQYELSTNYHNVVVNNYQRFIEVAQAFGRELPASLLHKLSNASDLDIRLMMPNGRTPDLNDGAWRDVRKTMEIRRRILSENEGIRWLADNDTAMMPKETSVVLPWSGFAVFRTGWGEQDAWALFDGAPFGRAHQHEDKLSVLYYANGKLLLTEAGNYAYDTSEMRAYVLSTRAHNTVRLDGQDQNRRRDYVWYEEDIHKKADLKARLGGTWEYAESNYCEGYGGERTEGRPWGIPDPDDAGAPYTAPERHNRRVYFFRGDETVRQTLLVVVDRFTAPGVHAWEALWHIDSEVKEAGTRCPSKEAGRGCQSFEEVDVAWSGGEADIVRGQEEPEWQGYVAISTKQGDYRPVNCLTVRNLADRLRVVTVLSPACGDAGRLAGVDADMAPEATRIEIRFADGTVLALDEAIYMV